MWSSYMYMALQMYVIGNVTVVVWHLYLFGYVYWLCTVHNVILDLKIFSSNFTILLIVVA